VDDEELARLLSGRDGPSVLEQEAGFERLLGKLGRRPAPVRWRLWLPGVAALAAAAAAVLLMVREPAPELVARGGQAREPALSVLCVEHGAAGRCPSGGRLAFVAEPGGFDYLALFARRGDGLVIWYFPSADGQSVPLADRSGKPLSHGIKLGEDQPPGSYELVGVFSRRPLTRAAIKRELGAALESGAQHRVVRQTLIVEHP
jgi:hypothetical protein